jgi:hypothetical protein
MTTSTILQRHSTTIKRLQVTARSRNSRLHVTRSKHLLSNDNGVDFLPNRCRKFAGGQPLGGTAGGEECKKFTYTSAFCSHVHSPCDIKISQFFLSFKSQAIAIICLEIKNVPTWWSSLMVFNEDSLVKSSKDSNRKVSNWSHSSFCRYDCKVVMFCMSRKCVICSELCFIFVCMSL